MSICFNRLTALLLPTLLLPASLAAQSPPTRDQGIFLDNPPSYYLEVILPAVEGKQKEKEEDRRVYKVDLSGRDLPTDPAVYTSCWHSMPVSQGQTNTCWSYATTSFYQSEVHRLSGKEVRLSEMYTVYWEYVERARYFVASKGEMFVGEGSETNAVGRMMAKYGIVPYEAYTGLQPGQVFHTHQEMFAGIRDFFEQARENELWDEEKVVAGVKSIMHRHMGVPPDKIKLNGKKITPLEYLHQELKINPKNYVHFMSLMNHPYFEKGEYEVPDNWWHSRDYHNVPLDDFMDALKSSLKAGYSVAIGGDVSEAGLVTGMGVGVVPSFDIPAAYIDENARYFRFKNGSTTDDHAMHLVGYLEKDGTHWFLVKDSGAGSRNCGEGNKGFGYYFFHEDYVKLKIMNFTVHKDAVAAILEKMGNP